MRKNNTVIAGAGGHASEVLDVLNEAAKQNIYLFDDVQFETSFIYNCKVLHAVDQLKAFVSFDFVLGVGDPFLRKQFYERLIAAGGIHLPLKSASASISSTCFNSLFDSLKNVFVGPNTRIGLGALLNTGAQVHHEAEIGAFTEISPRVVVLGRAEVGSFSRIGANATVLPKIKVGNNVIVAAGAVVTQNVPDDCLVAGVPAVVKKKLSPLVL